MQPVMFWKTVMSGMVAILVLAAIACGASATPTSAPKATTGPAVTNTPAPAVVATPGPTAMPKPSRIVSARNSITLVIGLEPVSLDPLQSGAGTTGSIYQDNVVDPLTWQSGNDQRIVATTAATGWQQLSPSQWRFTLRQGVKFQNGEPWNAQAALPSLQLQGQAGKPSKSYVYTGGYTAQAVDDYTVDILCAQACPIFPNTAIFLTFVAPNFLATTTEDQQGRTTVGFGPYKILRWQPGVSVSEEAYDGYTPAGDHYEFQKPIIKNVTWTWRGEPIVAAAMVKTGEADNAWDVGVESAKALPKEMVRSGSSAEVFAQEINTLWNPELKKLKVRQAMAHAINCQELIDSLYAGLTTCRGNIIWPGVVGATEANTAPYTYDPALSRRLLKEANYDPNTTLTFMARPNIIPKATEVYEATQRYLKEVGINVKVQMVDAQTQRSRRYCRAGAAVNDVLKASGREPGKDKPTVDDFQKALASGGASCPSTDMAESTPSSETLDFARNATFYLNCESLSSPHCDPSPGGFQEMLPKALAASGAERQQLMQAMADRVHNEFLWVTVFDAPVFYAINPKLNWTPRFDRRVRVNAMWFSP
ncbi:MAG: hypothetical protein EXR54_10455 [Dehalococcoidia bacterium]|nr:hypothetical protein [Dehalococcoidia bacterium]MSQ17948.1 hypothetical protein [Dehalococcoidia bacterium]